MTAWDRYVEQGTDGLTDWEREDIEAALQTAAEEAAHQYKKGES